MLASTLIHIIISEFLRIKMHLRHNLYHIINVLCAIIVKKKMVIFFKKIYILIINF